MMTTKINKIVLADFEMDNAESITEGYRPPENPETVDKVIAIINSLCRMYHYAELKDHDVITDNKLEFYVDYKFNGKHLGVITLALEKAANTEMWVAKVYLSVKKAQRLPMSNMAQFISDFKRHLKSLHINMAQKETEMPRNEELSFNMAQTKTRMSRDAINNRIKRHQDKIKERMAKVKIWGQMQKNTDNPERKRSIAQRMDNMKPRIERNKEAITYYKKILKYAQS